MPALAHADETGQLDVIPLDTGAIHEPGLPSLPMRKMSDEPMTRHANGDPRTDTPDKPGHPSYREEQDGPWELLGHPGSLQPRIETIVHETRLKVKLGGII
jgi:hypothetical protein